MSTSTSGIRGTHRGRPLILVTALAFGVSALACGDDSPTPPENHELHQVTQLTVSPLAADLAVGDEVALTATAKCDHGIIMHPTMVWSSDASDVATVDATGKVTAVGFGETAIIVEAATLAAYAEITVAPEGTVVDATGGTVTFEGLTLEIPAGALTEPTDIVVEALDDALFTSDPLYVEGTAYAIEPDALVLNGGATLTIKYDKANIPGQVTEERLLIRERDEVQEQWREMTQNRVRLQERLVEAHIEHLGQYGIGARDDSGTPVGAINVTPPELSLRPGQTGQLSAAVIDNEGNPLDKSITWTSSDEAVATVSVTGLVTAVADGEATITAAAGDKTSTAKVFVATAIGTITVTPDAAAVDEGATVQLAAEAKDAEGNVLVRTFAWTSSDDAIATVDENGLVTGVDAGSATISASADGITGSAAITVNAVIVSVAVSQETLSLFEGDVVQLEAVALDKDGEPVTTDFVWTSSDESIAVVSETGLVTAVGTGNVTITAAAGGKQGGSGVNVGRIGSVTVTPSAAWVGIGMTTQLVAEAFDADGNPVDRTFTWTSSSAVATVDASGLVTGVAEGTATITARTGGASADATVTVTPPVSRVEIADIGNEPLEVPLTLQLVARAYDAQGVLVPNVPFAWSSSMPNVASVDQTGLVTALMASPQAKVVITAAVGTISDQVEIRVVGEGEEETGGNNMSWPVVFADGIGLLGSPVATDPGVRPLAAEGIVVDVLPFWWSENVPDYDTYYLQNSTSVWRAEYIDGTGQPRYDAEVKFGDNLFAKNWTTTRPIRVEVAMSATGVGTLRGFNMFLLEGEGATEIQGTDGSTADFVPLIYLEGAIITVERIDGPDGQVLAELFSGDPTVEMNGAGRIIWGYQLDLETWTPPAGVTKEGMYRISFTIPSEANATITSVFQGEDAAVASVVNPREAKIEITVVVQ